MAKERGNTVKEVTVGVTGRWLVVPPEETSVRMLHRFRNSITSQVAQTFHRNWFSVKDELHRKPESAAPWKVFLAVLTDILYVLKRKRRQEH